MADDDNNSDVVEGIIEFEVPDKLREYGFTRFALLEYCNLFKAVYNGFAITATYDKNNFSSTMKRIRENASDVITSNGKAKSDIIEDFVRQVALCISDHVEKTGPKNSIAIAKNKEQAVTVCKYTDAISGTLYETVKLSSDGKFYLVSYDNSTGKLVIASEAQEKNRTLKPYTEIGTDPYTFEDAEELEQYIELAKHETLSSLFTKVKHYAKLFYDTDTEAYINLIAADIIFTYFQDRIGKTHYIFVYGEPGTGKGAILETFNQLAYRGVQVTDASAASVYRLLGSVEKGQVILIIDEANRLEDDSFLLDVLKVGYKGSTKVPRVMDAQSSSESKIEYFYAYCFKIIAAEHLPAHWKTGGFLSRCLLIHTSPGNPPLDISDIVDNAGDPKNAKIMLELSKLRKLLFTYRLLNYSEPIPDIGGIKGIFGRDRELIKPLIRLFKAHGGDTESLEVIKQTLHHFIKERNQETTDSFVATIYRLVRQLTENIADSSSVTTGWYELTYSDIWQNVKEQLDGDTVEGKPGTIDTNLFGEIGTRRLTSTLKSLGGKSTRDKTGDRRVWIFNDKTLDRFNTVYRQVPDTIELEGEGQLTLDDDPSSDTSDTSQER
jgi:hypothetical protein